MGLAQKNQKRKRNQVLPGELASLRDFFDYNTFVRKKYLETLSKLPKNTLTKNTGASFPSTLSSDIFDSMRNKGKERKEHGKAEEKVGKEFEDKPREMEGKEQKEFGKTEEKIGKEREKKGLS